MCIICKDWELGKLTKKEALSNLSEFIQGNENEEDLYHYFELATKLSDPEEDEDAY